MFEYGGLINGMRRRKSASIRDATALHFEAIVMIPPRVEDWEAAQNQQEPLRVEDRADAQKHQEHALHVLHAHDWVKLAG